MSNSTKSSPVSAGILSNPIHLIAFGLGTGLAPKAPGTIGTLLGIPVYLALSNLDFSHYILACIALFIFGCWVCGKSAQLLKVHDHGGIVFDEIVGYCITAIPLFWFGNSLLGLSLAFVFFRFFDVIKPWPIRWLDAKVHGGFGIMIDDALAAVFAGLCLWGALVLLA